MNIIAAADSQNGIGLNGNLLYRIPEDMRYFKHMTYGKVVVMGHSTLKALPNASPLPGRTNIVLTRNADIKADGCIICHSLEDLFRAIAPYETNDVFVIGGEMVYTQLLDYCSKAYITQIHSAAPADRFFPRIGDNKEWALVSESEMKEHNGIRFTFREYANHAVKAFP